MFIRLLPILMMVGWVTVSFAPPHLARAQESGFTVLDEILPSAQQVSVGVYPITVYSLDIQNNTYYVDAYVWFKWQGEINPTESIEFVNAVEDWGMTKIYLIDEPEVRDDGSFYQIMRVEGRFFQPFDFDNFPLDRQQLSIKLEDSTHSVDELVYLPDLKDSGIGDTVLVPGWTIEGWSANSQKHHYDTEFGESGESDASNFAVLEYTMTIARPIHYFIWKLLLPLIIVLIASWTALLLHPSLVEARTALPATALLTTVFLQQSYSASLPTSANLVLLDKIYVLAYILLIATIIQVITISIQGEKLAENNYARAVQIDRYSVIIQVLVFVVGTLLLIFMT